MELRKALSTIRSGFLLLLVVSFSYASIAHSAKKNQTTESSSDHQLRIVQVFVDTANDQLLIQGENFDNGGDPVVTLGSVELNVDLFSSDATNILADLPPGLLDGDYVLGVKTGTGTPKFDEYDLTVGGGSGSIETVSRSNSVVTGPLVNGQSISSEADCNAGEVATGGGGRTNLGYWLSMTESYPGSTVPSSWIVRYTNKSGTTTPSGVVEAIVVCTD